VVGVSDPSTTDTDRDLVYVDGWPDRLFGNVLHDGPDGQCIYIYAGIEERCPNDPVAWTHFNGKPIEMCAEHCPVDVPELPSTEQQELVTDGGQPAGGSEQLTVGDMVSVGASERVDGIRLRVTGLEYAIADIEFEDGGDTRVVFTREQAEAFREQIADTYRMHDENTGGQPGDCDE
jgi:hypothetical protein